MLTLQKQFELPLVQDLIQENEKLRATAELAGTEIPISKIEGIKVPYVFKNKLLMQAGEFNGVVYPKEEIMAKVDEALDVGMMYDHLDTEGQGCSSWIGKIANPRWDVGEKGEGLYGDLIIVDKPCAQKLAAGAKWGISPTIDYEVNDVNGKTIGTNLLWKSFSFVITPAVRATMLNSEKGGKTKMSEDKKIKYPVNQSASTEEGSKSLSLEVDQQTLEVLKAKDSEIAELQKFRTEMENAKKQVLVNDLVSNEFLIGRLEEDEISERQKTLMSKSTEMLSELNEIVGSHAELAKFGDFVKAYMQKNKGASIKEAAKAWKKENPAGKKELSEEGADGEDSPKAKKLASLSLTAPPDSDTKRKLAILQESHPNITNVDVGMYNAMCENYQGGILL